MIRINLLPERPRGGKVDRALALPWKKIGKNLAIVVVSVSFLLLASEGIHGLLRRGLQTEWEKVRPQVERLESTRAVLLALQNRAAVLKTLKSPQARWAPRLNLLSDALVSNLWLSSLQFSPTASEGTVLILQGSTSYFHLVFCPLLKTREA